MILKRKCFGVASKALGVVSPGAWNAKEAAKYSFEDDKERYDNNKWGYAVRGAFAPGTASWQLHRAKELKKKGYTPEEIKREIEKSNVTKTGVAEALTGLSAIGNNVALVNGFKTALDEERAHPRYKDYRKHSDKKKKH